MVKVPKLLLLCFDRLHHSQGMYALVIYIEDEMPFWLSLTVGSKFFRKVKEFICFLQKINSVALFFSPLANHTDRSTASGRRN
jgi:hypothetical protein